ncbi:MAG: S41 family peptidase [Negativicutes bacterium]|nr:S41 family peptidase [Negativicutes bacterium]
MQKARNITVKVLIAWVVLAAWTLTGAVLMTQQSLAYLPVGLRAAAAEGDTAQVVTTSQDQMGLNPASTGVDDKGDTLRAASINEINWYLSKMDAADVASTLKLFRVMQLIKAGYVADVGMDTLLSGAVKGTVNALGDPHSVYLDPKLYKELSIATKGSYGGVGMILGIKDKLLTVVAPIEGTAADKAGIMGGDWIQKINGRETKDMVLDEAVNMIRGPEGSQITLTISRPGEEVKEYQLVRTNIQLKTVSGKMLENNIGYIRVTMFNENTGDDFDKKVRELEGQGMKAVILDLRNNPGGLVSDGVKVAEHFVPKGRIVSVVTRDGTRDTYFSQLEAPKYPLVVLVNGGSASASEIVAGAVQDTAVGTLVGTKTYGKGSVQRVARLDNDSAVKLTVAKYYTPKDRMIDGVGLEPDIVVAMPDPKDSTDDLQLNKAIEVLNEKL